MRRKSLTLTEIIVGALIMASLFGGLMSAFVAVRRYVSHANRRVVAANLSRMGFGDLIREVRQDTWDSGRLSVGNQTFFGGGNLLIDGFTYSGGYIVSQDAGVDYRQVEMNIQYIEAPPQRVIIP